MATVKNAMSILFNDGEGVAEGDLNDIQRALHGSYIDTLLASGAVLNAPWSTYQVSSNLYCYQQGMTGYPEAHPVNALTIYNSTPGMIAQWVDDAHGPEYVASGTDLPDPKLLIYYLQPGDIQFESDPAHATLHRYDCIDIKLELVDADAQSRDFEDSATRVLTTTTPSKKRRVQMTAVLTKGINGATPGLPSVPSGYCRYAGAYIPATYAAAFDNAVHVLDFTMPMKGLATEAIYAPHMINPNSNATYSGNQYTFGASQTVFAQMKNNSAANRIAKVATLTSMTGATITHAFYRYSNGLTGTDLSTPIGDIVIGSGTNHFSVQHCIANDDGTTLPLWANGYRAGRACFFDNFNSATNWLTSLGLRFTQATGAPVIHSASFAYFY